MHRDIDKTRAYFACHSFLYPYTKKHLSMSISPCIPHFQLIDKYSVGAAGEKIALRGSWASIYSLLFLLYSFGDYFSMRCCWVFQNTETLTFPRENNSRWWQTVIWHKIDYQRPPHRNTFSTTTATRPTRRLACIWTRHRACNRLFFDSHFFSYCHQPNCITQLFSYIL